MSQNSHNTLEEKKVNPLISDCLENPILHRDEQWDIIKRLNEKGIFMFTLECQINDRKGLFIDLTSSEKVLRKSDFSNLIMDGGSVLMDESRLVCDDEGNVLGVQILTYTIMFHHMFWNLTYELEKYEYLQKREEADGVELSEEFKNYMNKRRVGILELIANLKIFENLNEMLETQPRWLLEMDLEADSFELRF
jgi:hypothetical protein